MECLCGAEAPSTDDPCPQCGLDGATLRAIRQAEQAAPPVVEPDTWKTAPHCQNCFRKVDAEARYCDECADLLDLSRKALVWLTERHQEALEAAKAWDVPLVPDEPLAAVLARDDAELAAAGWLREPRARAAWIPSVRPEVAWLAYLDGPALAFHAFGDAEPERARIHREVLLATFPQVREIEWRALLR